MNSLVLGQFDSENLWHRSTLRRLPMLVDWKAHRSLIHCMDEILFPFCNQGDILVCRNGMNAHLHQYLINLGFQFACNQTSLEQCETDTELTIFQLIAKYPKTIQQLTSNRISNLCIYSVVDGAEEMLNILGIEQQLPARQSVIQVNSKTYSTELRRRLHIDNYGIVVRSTADLKKHGKFLLESGPILIKDPFGVSGQGTIKIQSTTMLDNIVRHLDRQCESDTELVLEPFLMKKMDFSCLFNISADGAFSLFTVQIMKNKTFNYAGSECAKESFYDLLNKADYFSTVEKIARQIFSDGYFGDVCLDSMMLENGEIKPLIEINARKSMSLINYYINLYLNQYQRHGQLSFFHFSFDKTIRIDMMLSLMEKHHILFTLHTMEGIILLSANTANYSANKGRIYVCTVVDTNDNERKEFYINEMKNILLACSCKVHS